MTAAPTGAWRSVFHHGNSDTERTSAQWLQPGAMSSCNAISTTNNYNDYFCTDNFPLDQWVHFADVKQGGKHLLYYNGVLQRSAALSGPGVGNNGPIYMGKDPVWDGITGLLDEVRIYRRALSQAEIQQHMQ